MTRSGSEGMTCHMKWLNFLFLPLSLTSVHREIRHEKTDRRQRPQILNVKPEIMRQLIPEGTLVIVKSTGQKHLVKYDYEDLIYLVGIPEPFTFDQIKIA